MILYRPIGLEELSLIFDANFNGFPPRLPEQPIFYPVLNREYAEQIARDWNTKSNSFAGYVTRFSIDDEYAKQFEPKVVGAKKHAELWVPAGELDNFNTHLERPISIISSFFGDGFLGYIPNRFILGGKTAIEQIGALAITLEYSSFDFVMEISANAKTVFLNFRFWEQLDPSRVQLEKEELSKVLTAVQDAWAMRKIGVPLI